MRKKHKTISNTSVRLSAHERLCAERMVTLIKSIDELRAEVKDLRGDMNKGKGVIYFVLFLGTIATALASFFQFKG
jgi:hypothetical protein